MQEYKSIIDDDKRQFDEDMRANMKNHTYRCIMEFDTPSIEFHNICNHFARYDRIQLMKHFISRYYPREKKFTKDTCIIAAKFGNINYFKLMVKTEKELPWDIEALYTAILYNHLKCVKYMFKNGCPFTSLLIIVAVKLKRVKIFKYLNNRVNDNEISIRSFIIATANGYLPITRIILRSIYTIPEDAWKLAVKNGRSLILEEFLENDDIDPLLHKQLCIDAISFDQFECFKILSKSNIPDEILIAASENENPEFIKYCIENMHAEGEIIEECCFRAAKAGKYKNFKFLINYFCNNISGTFSDTKLMEQIAINGNIKCMVCAHKHGYPWNKSVTDLAAAHGNYKCLKYAVINGCEYDDEVFDLV